MNVLRISPSRQGSHFFDVEKLFVKFAYLFLGNFKPHVLLVYMEFSFLKHYKTLQTFPKE